MPILPIYEELESIALLDFADVVVSSQIMALPTGDPLKLRLEIVDVSFVDVFVSPTGRYSYHWERRLTPTGDLYRHDNAPHSSWSRIATFPKHFHDGNEKNVRESDLSDRPDEAIREFLAFVRGKLLGLGG